MKRISCKEAEMLFDEKIDGMISQENDARLSAHLDTCETCRASYQKTLALSRYLHSLSEEEVPSSLHESVMEGIRKEPKRRSWKPRALRSLAAVGAAALVCLALLNSPLLRDFASKDSICDHPLAGEEILDIPPSDHVENMTALPEMTDKNESTIDGTLDTQTAYPLEGTSLFLQICDESTAILLDEDTALLSLTYQKTDGGITLASNGKTQILYDNKTGWQIGEGDLLAPYLP